jgi:hypothetical protein
VTSTKLEPKLTSLEIKGVPMDRRNVIYQNDIDESVKKLVDELAKEGFLR